MPFIQTAFTGNKAQLLFHMKKVLLASAIIASVLNLSSCGLSRNLTTNQNQNQTSVVLSQKNYKIVGKVSGSVSGTYIIGMGSLRKKALRNNAIDEMIKNAGLKGSQAIVNTTVKQSVKMITPFYAQVNVTATGNIIEFTK